MFFRNLRRGRPLYQNSSPSRASMRRPVLTSVPVRSSGSRNVSLTRLVFASQTLVPSRSLRHPFRGGCESCWLPPTGFSRQLCVSGCALPVRDGVRLPGTYASLRAGCSRP